jgi:hypothetical protein
MEATMKNIVFRDVTPLGLVEVYRTFGEKFRLHLHGGKMGA